MLDVGFFLEGGPRILGCVRVSRLNLALAEPLLFIDSPPPSPGLTTPATMGNTPATTAPPTHLKASVRTAVAGGDAKSKGDMPLGNPQFDATWEDNAESHSFRVRGPGYLSGGGKVDAGKPFGRFVRADLYKVGADSGATADGATTPRGCPQP